MRTDTQHRTGRSWGRNWWSRGWVLGVLLGLLGGWQPCQAVDFTCPAGASGVAYLIDAINEANANGEENIITLAAGTYTLTASNNGTVGDTNGLPVIMSHLTILGAGAATTIIERDTSAPEFRFLTVAGTGTLTLKGLTLRGGSVSLGQGGGIVNNQGTVTLTNCSLTDNTAGNSGGGIDNQGGAGLQMQNTILALNTAPAAAPQADDCVGVVTSLGTNLIGDRTGCTITLQSSDLEGDPGLAAFTDDGTPGNGHFPLVPASQAINKGNDAACPLTDQLGQPRVGQCDIGAIEFQSSDTTPPAITVTATPDTLWPPNGRLVPVTIVATITDAGSGVDPSTTAYAVENEYGSVEPSGSLTLGHDGRYTATICLQASRRGNDADGRLYTITVSAFDNEGNEGSAATSVIVPHDQGQGRSLAAR